MKELTSFNINECVHVKLTQAGKKELKRQWHVMHDEWPQAFPKYTEKKEDDQGFSKWQMHNLMHDLGHMCIMGSDLPFEPGIKIEIDGDLG